MHAHHRFAVALLAVGALATAGCSSDRTVAVASDRAATSGVSTPAASGGGPAVTGTITVLAAASLTEAFTTLGQQFERAHPGAKVTLSFGASSALALQINQGAPADVFASAATTNMTQVVTAGGATAAAATNFAANVLEIAVPSANPQNVTGVADLAKSTVKTVTCQTQVPCGAAAVKLFANAKVTVTPVSQEADVKSTLTKIEANEADAGIVYVTDVRAAGNKVKGIEIPSDVNVSTEYPIAPLTKATNTVGAQAFVDYVLSADGQKLLAADGFAKA